MRRLRAIKWLVLLDVAKLAYEHWGYLEKRDRAELGRLVRKSRGKPGNLTAREQKELRRLVGKLEPLDFVRGVSPFGGKRKFRR